VFASTVGVYGDAPSPLREDGPTRPVDSYGLGKLMIEQELGLTRRHAGGGAGRPCRHPGTRGRSTSGPHSIQIPSSAGPHGELTMGPWEPGGWPGTAGGREA
jgi:hypothetical protein